MPSLARPFHQPRDILLGRVLASAGKLPNEDRMPSYVSIIDWTDQGIANFKDTVDRYEAAQQQFERLGVRFTDVYWTLGEHDLVAVLEAPDDETATAAMLAVGAQGNIRTKTMRAFSRDEMRAVIAKTA
jgi:uncharacterized protein with GYD domain